MKKINKRKIGIGLLVGFFLFIWTLDASRSEDAIQTAKNLIAAHDSSSKQYNNRCFDCHADILTQKSLNPSIPNAHVAMLPFTPGNRDRKCVWCHRSVDLVQGSTRFGKSKSNLRKGVNMILCTLCHGPSGPGNQFFQTELSPTQPDGALLYDLACAACHGDLANSQVKGESASEIQKKINENEGGMGPLMVLEKEEIQAIANALAQ